MQSEAVHLKAIDRGLLDMAKVNKWTAGGTVQNVVLAMEEAVRKHTGPVRRGPSDGSTSCYGLPSELIMS